MKKHEVIWADVAIKDLSNIVDYISHDSVNNALKVFHKIKSRCEKLYVYPNRGRVVPELREYGILLYRELIIDPWRVVYRITDDSVLVLSVIDARQNVEDVLLSRFVKR